MGMMYTSTAACAHYLDHSGHPELPPSHFWIIDIGLNYQIGIRSLGTTFSKVHGPLRYNRARKIFMLNVVVGSIDLLNLHDVNQERRP